MLTYKLCMPSLWGESRVAVVCHVEEGKVARVPRDMPESRNRHRPLVVSGWNAKRLVDGRSQSGRAARFHGYRAVRYLGNPDAAGISYPLYILHQSVTYPHQLAVHPVHPFLTPFWPATSHPSLFLSPLFFQLVLFASCHHCSLRCPPNHVPFKVTGRRIHGC